MMDIKLIEGAPRLLKDYSVPHGGLIQSSILRPAIQASSFEINPEIILMIKRSVQFVGLPDEDPYAHVADFLEICDTFRLNGVSDDAIRLLLFPFSLRDRAKSWLRSLPSGSITTWDELAQKFLTKYFPLIRTVRMRNEIISFLQNDSESLYEAWERYNDLLRKCPHHGIPKWLQVQIFYDGLLGMTRITIDAAAGGALMGKSIDQAYEILEKMAASGEQWPSERMMPKKIVGVHGIDAHTALTAKVTALSKRVDAMCVHTTRSTMMSCEICRGEHSSDHCAFSHESVLFDAHCNTPYSRNSSCNNNKGVEPVFHPTYPPQAQTPTQETKPSLEDILMQDMAKKDAVLQGQAAAIQDLEVQIGRLANAITMMTKEEPLTEPKVSIQGIEQTEPKKYSKNSGLSVHHQGNVDSEREHLDNPVENCMSHGATPQHGSRPSRKSL